MEIPSFNTPSAASTAGFLAIVLACVSAAIAAVRYTSAQRRRTTWLAVAAAVGWLGVTAAYVASGLVQAGPPGLLGFFLIAVGGAVGLALSPLGTRMANQIPLVALVGFQTFRLPLELVLHAWAETGTIPGQMTYTGHNFDILTGSSAAAILAWASTSGHVPQWLLIGFNALGSALLLAVMTIVVLSSPLPIKQYPGDPIILAFYLPYAWILPVCVAGAMCGHLVLWRSIAHRAAT